MIDKLEVRVPSITKFSPQFESLRPEWLYGLKHSRLYIGVEDLRPLDHPCILHFQHKRTRDHKIEIIDAGSLSLSRMIYEIQRIFDVDALQLHVMRLDLAADMKGIPVHAFVGNVRGKWKRVSADLGRYTRIGKLSVETFYLGKRPNLFRVYDKIEEFKVQYAKLKRQLGGDIPGFEDVFRYPPSGLILTRIERQMGGGRIPAQIGTVGGLADLPNFDPFDRLEIVAGSAVPPPPDGRGFVKHLKGLGLRDLVREHGLQNARRMANKYTRGNASRLFKEYSDYLPGSGFQISEREIFERYRESVSQQVAA